MSFPHAFVAPRYVPKFMPDATLIQAAPVQNTWYTVLNTTPNVKLYQIALEVADTAETLEVRVTIDGNVLVGSQNATAGTDYWVVLPSTMVSDALQITSSAVSAIWRLPEGRSVKVEIRKTTAAGAGNITCIVKYAKW